MMRGKQCDVWNLANEDVLLRPIKRLNLPSGNQYGSQALRQRLRQIATRYRDNLSKDGGPED